MPHFSSRSYARDTVSSARGGLDPKWSKNQGRIQGVMF